MVKKMVVIDDICKHCDYYITILEDCMRVKTAFLEPGNVPDNCPLSSAPKPTPDKPDKS